MTTSTTLHHVTRWREQLEEAKSRRDHWIRLAHIEGMSLSVIAAAAGLTRQRVHQIVTAEPSS